MFTYAHAQKPLDETDRKKNYHHPQCREIRDDVVSVARVFARVLVVDDHVDHLVHLDYQDL